jgi:phosphoesterase RecJ-like protein
MEPDNETTYLDQCRKFEALEELIDQAETIAICPHTNPDGDALGSVLGLADIIEQRWGDAKRVAKLLPDDAEIPATLRFLPGADAFEFASSYEETPDLFIAVDLPSASRLANAKPVVERARHVAVIDHHPSDEPFGEVHVERVDAAATGVIVAELAVFLMTPISKDMANCLMCAVMTDTGCFQYQNADSEAFEIASQLVDAGAEPARISLEVYQSFTLAYLHLKSIVMGRIVTLYHGKIAYSYATRADLERTGARDDECDGLIDLVRSVEGTEVALFLKETATGRVRGNLRAKGKLDVSLVAKYMGGGGHRAAAGFSCDGPIDEAYAKVLPLLKNLVDGKPIDSAQIEI